MRGIRYIGKKGLHARFKVLQDGTLQNVIAFNMSDLFKFHIDDGAYVDILYEIQVNSWNGRENLQLNLHDIRLAS